MLKRFYCKADTSEQDYVEIEIKPKTESNLVFIEVVNMIDGEKCESCVAITKEEMLEIFEMIK